MEYAEVDTKHILNTHKHNDGGWFWTKYSTSPYMGCEWACSYCYAREKKYNPHKGEDVKTKKFKDAFSEYIKIKKNAPELLRKALLKKPRDLIYVGHCQPIDSRYMYICKMLEVCLDLHFPVFINEKSSMILNDLEVIKKINKDTYANVGWSIITAEDNKEKLVFEPKSPSIKSRFDAMRKLSGEGVMTGTVFMPALPFIFDTEENIRAVVQKTKESGGKYILCGGLTLFGYCGTFFYEVLKRYDSSLVEKYKKLFGSKSALERYNANLYSMVKRYCQMFGLTHFIPRPIAYFPQNIQLNKKIAEKFFLKARELLTLGTNVSNGWAYLKAARLIDEFPINIKDFYTTNGKLGLIKLPAIGASLAEQIIEILKQNS
jgi:DNA repair photolyase